MSETLVRLSVTLLCLDNIGRQDRSGCSSVLYLIFEYKFLFGISPGFFVNICQLRIVFLLILNRGEFSYKDWLTSILSKNGSLLNFSKGEFMSSLMKQGTRQVVVGTKQIWRNTYTHTDNFHKR